MDSTDLSVLKILVETNKTLYNAQKSNRMRINSFKDITNNGYNYLETISVDSLDNPLEIIKEEIKNNIVYFLEYTDYLKHINEVTLYDAAELIVLIGNINRFNSKSKFVSYCGFAPMIQMNGKIYNFSDKRVVNSNNHKNVVGNAKSYTKNINYNERLKDLILKVVRKLIIYNEKYKVYYEGYFDWYINRHPDYNVKHIEYMAKRRVCKMFVEEIYKNFKKINEVE